MRGPFGPSHSRGQDVLAPRVDASRFFRRHRLVVRETNAIGLVYLLYDVSSPGAGTERSHTAGCRYTVLISCMHPCWQTGHTAPGSTADTAGVLRSTASARAWGCAACPRRMRHCPS